MTRADIDALITDTKHRLSPEWGELSELRPRFDESTVRKLVEVIEELLEDIDNGGGPGEGLVTVPGDLCEYCHYRLPQHARWCKA